MKLQYDDYFVPFQTNVLLRHSFITCCKILHFTHFDMLLKLVQLGRLQQSLHMYEHQSYTKDGCLKFPYINMPHTHTLTTIKRIHKLQPQIVCTIHSDHQQDIITFWNINLLHNYYKNLKCVCVCVCVSV